MPIGGTRSARYRGRMDAHDVDRRPQEMSAQSTPTIQPRAIMAANQKPRILDVGCGRKKYPGSIGIDMSAAGQADVLCDWTRTPFADSTFDEVRLIHMIEEVDDIFKVLAESRRQARRPRRNHDAALHRSRLLLQPRAPLASLQLFPLVLQREARRVRLLRPCAIPRAPRPRHPAAHLARARISVPDKSFPLVPQVLGVLFVLRHSRQDSRMGTRSSEVVFPPVLARFIFAMIDFAARKGLGATPPTQSASSADGAAGDPAKHRARQTGIRGETYAYWYLRRHGYVLVARNFTSPGIKGEIDMVGYDGQTLAFVEVKTRTIVVLAH